MKLDIDSIESYQDLISEIPELRQMESWNKFRRNNVDRNQLTKYLVYFYSRDSFLHINGRVPFEQRKIRAGMLAGFKNSDGIFDEYVETYVFGLQDPHILDMVMDYLRFQNDYYWSEICALEASLDEINRLRMKPVGEDDDEASIMKAKSLARKEAESIIESLEIYYKKFYGEFLDVKKAQVDRKYMRTMETEAKPLSAP